MTNKNAKELFDTTKLDNLRILQICFNIFPGAKTVLHKFVDAPISIFDLQRLFEVSNNSLIFDKFQCNIPFFQDCNGQTPLELALDKKQTNLANCLLWGIQNYPYLHSGPMLAKGINQAFEADCPQLGDFLEARLVEDYHVSNRMTHKAIKEMIEGTTNFNYATMVADPWQDLNVMEKQMFDPKAFEQNIRVRYFDIPELHTFSE